MFWTNLSAFIFAAIGLVIGIYPALLQGQPIMKSLILLFFGVLVGLSLFASFQKYFRRNYSKRSVLSGLDEELSKTKESWALWQTGTFARNVGDSVFIKLKQLILVDPTSPYLEIIASEVNRTPEAVISDIRETTRKAEQFGVKVKWYSGTISETMVLGNPRTIRGWIRLESGYPRREAQNRSGRTVYRIFDWKLYRLLQNQYEEIWEKSRDADLTRSFDEYIKDAAEQIIGDDERKAIYDQLVASVGGISLPWTIGPKKELHEFRDAEVTLRESGIQLPKEVIERALRWYIERGYLVESRYAEDPPETYRHFSAAEEFLPIRRYMEKNVKR